MKVSIVDAPAMHIMARAIAEIANLGPGEVDRAPEIARTAALDALAIVQERNE